MLEVLARIFSFSDWSRNHPAEPHPGDMLDASFDALLRKIDEIEAKISQLRAETASFQAFSVLSQSKGLTAGSHDAGDAEAWAQSSMAWAEHMPDTIPDGYLTEMDITGDHWSARWWAHYAARVTQARTLLHGTSTRYLFVAIAGQTTFSGFDHYGVPFLVDWDGHDVMVFVDGRLKTPDFDYQTSTDDTLVLAVSVPVNTRVEIVSTVPWDIEPVWQLETAGWVFDGMAKTFPLLDKASGNPIVPEWVHDVSLSLDGVWLNAGVDFTVLDDDLTFGDAPAADCLVFGQARGGLTVTP